jgi:transposase InsO family protein
LPDKSSSTIIETLINEYISRYSTPKEILSDNALEFTSTDFENALKNLNIKHGTTSFYWPRANGKMKEFTK